MVPGPPAPAPHTVLTPWWLPAAPPLSPGSRAQTPAASGRNLWDEQGALLGEGEANPGRMLGRRSRRMRSRAHGMEARGGGIGDRHRAPSRGRVGREAVAHARGGSRPTLPPRRPLPCLLRAPLLTSSRRDLGSMTWNRAGAPDLWPLLTPPPRAPPCRGRAGRGWRAGGGRRGAGREGRSAAALGVWLRGPGSTRHLGPLPSLLD
jgi:hypothetical protein